MPEEAKIDDRADEKAGALSTETAGVGHNQLSQPQFLMYMARHTALEEKADEIRKAKNLMRRDMKNNGIDCGLFDHVRKEMDLSPDVLAENQTKISLYRHLAGLAPDEQGDFISALEQSKQETDEEKAGRIKQQGFIESMSGRGKTSDECPYEAGTQEAEHWQDGWMEGQKSLAKQLKEHKVELGK